MKPKRFVESLMTLAAAWGITAFLAGPAGSAQDNVASKSSGPVYVRNFYFDAQNLKADPGLLGGRGGPMGRLLQGLKPSADPAAKAQKLAALLCNTIVSGLNDAGIFATRLDPGVFTPSFGLLVGGEFLEVDEGNRMRRAMVGFGAGSEEVKV